VLTLSGHTHGGQVRILGWSPWIPSRYGLRYAYGHMVEAGRDLIVSAGLGSHFVAGRPLRLGIPPEIVVVDLGAFPEGDAKPAALARGRGGPAGPLGVIQTGGSSAGDSPISARRRQAAP
jgi:hypothetical protein